MHIDLKPVAMLDDNERAALKALTAAVYPPEVVAVRPGRHLQWAPPEGGVSNVDIDRNNSL
jgi:aminoglycoside 2'-N-acetyltransferase I